MRFLQQLFNKNDKIIYEIISNILLAFYEVGWRI